MDRVDLNKNVFGKNDFLKTVDTTFNELIKPPVIEEKLMSVDIFFKEYERLFFEIPKEGEFNSHEYLVQRSGEYINFDKINEEIQVLLDEIADLRQEILDLNQENYTLKLQNSGIMSDSDVFNKQLATIIEKDISTSRIKVRGTPISSTPPIQMPKPG
jgi:hypothetical protein